VAWMFFFFYGGFLMQWFFHLFKKQKTKNKKMTQSDKMERLLGINRASRVSIDCAHNWSVRYC